MAVYAVTGGAGFLGSYIVKLLINMDDVQEIRVIDIVDTEHPHTSRVKDIKYIKCDINDFSKMREALDGVNLIIHAAALVDVFGKYTDSEIMNVNYYGTQTVLAACVDLGIKYLIYTSSMEVIGPNKKGDPFIGNEYTPYDISPGHVYAKSKRMAEELVMSANNSVIIGGAKMFTCCLRPTGIYGEGDNLMKTFYNQCKQNGNIMYRTVDDDAVHSRVYVGNVAWMHVLAAKYIQYPGIDIRGKAYFCYDYSPVCSYDTFNLMLMNPLGIQLGSRIPKWILKLHACKNDIMRILFKKHSILNNYTLKISNNTFEVRTNLAELDFNYVPIFDYDVAFERTTKWLES
ncbi:3 beta-hydroxysteroid dehydrogenase/delta 5-_4 isomerase [Skunkpox virus]|uniref:3 beta-hydroxysteroid dehydrogenase/Delta 5-->4-isomerase n=1 Tax=Skunkpox virus TaxID=160796 RepID=A0A1C9KBV8_9POXV|nr:nucleotide-sugar epimerase [Skunkpox virus]AOP31644.1 3 beta-hydroxysteroid dehydrogenase/delta 5->4 isomerase [Skunkpox virus]